MVSSRIQRLILLSAVVLAGVPVRAAEKANAPGARPLRALQWRFVGPMRGGRVNAVVGHPANKNVFYAGYTGGGVWKTEDVGSNWVNLSDGQIRTGSIGAIDISRSHPEILYVGTGEHALRGDVSHGDGVYKSSDGGKSWVNVGLKDTRQIARVIIHPANPDIVYVAAVGHFAGPNTERGVFRTKNGGDTWQKVLYQDENAGVIDLEMDRERPHLLYAATWDVRRYPWGIRSGGEGSRIYRSKDGGDTWQEITENPGLPKARVRERIGLSLTEAKPGRAYVLISSDLGKGLFRTDDGGDTWTLTSDDVRLFARAYYYMHIVADPSVADRVYVAAEELFVSEDAGKSFEEVPCHYDDHHDLWIDPDDADRIVDGQDHGALISVNRGRTWSSPHNQPTAQIYTLATDNRFPYWLYGSQQDWGSVAVSSRPLGSRSRLAYEYETANSEAGHTALDPDAPDLLYVSDHHWMFKHDRRTGYEQFISPSEDLHYGWGTADQKYRFFWTFPVIHSRHGKALYTGSQYLHRSTDGGDSWTVISPDLTAAEPETLEKTPLYGRDVSSNGPYWGPLTRDSNGDNWNATLYTIAESPLRAGLIWTGSDDGLVHLTRDDGASWQNVTPPDLARRTLVSRIEASPFHEASAYVAATRFKVDDFTPLIYKTHDYGRTWTRITNGIEPDDFVRVVRADPRRRGVLFAGTETGVYYSIDDGASWARLQNNLPHLPVYDMQVKDGDLAIATHGRGYWVLDDVSVFAQMAEAPDGTYLFQPSDAYRHRPLRGVPPLASPAPYGVFVHYTLAAPAGSIELRFKEADGDLIRAYRDVPNAAGLNRFVWTNQRYPGAQELKSHPTRSSRDIGPYALPGVYQVELVVDGVSSTRSFSLLPDPNSRASAQDLTEQFAFVSAVRDTISHVNRMVLAIRIASASGLAAASMTDERPCWRRTLSSRRRSRPMTSSTEWYHAKATATTSSTRSQDTPFAAMHDRPALSGALRGAHDDLRQGTSLAARPRAARVGGLHRGRERSWTRAGGNARPPGCRR
jgi:photosystem II stability/assembly factor-like uncharacterized protein